MVDDPLIAAAMVTLRRLLMPLIALVTRTKKKAILFGLSNELGLIDRGS